MFFLLSIHFIFCSLYFFIFVNLSLCFPQVFPGPFSCYLLPLSVVQFCTSTLFLPQRQVVWLDVADSFLMVPPPWLQYFWELENQDTGICKNDKTEK